MEENNAGYGCSFLFLIVGVVAIAIGKNTVLGVSAVVVGISLGILSLILQSDKEKKKKEDERQRERHSQSASRLFEFQENAKAKSYNVTISVTTDKDGYEYSIKGINYCNIDDSMLGDFFGTARALRSNTHDPYAIGVYRGNKRVGFLPRGNSELHAQIMAAGGSVDIEGYIAKATEDGHTFYYGKVNLL